MRDERLVPRSGNIEMNMCGAEMRNVRLSHQVANRPVHGNGITWRGNRSYHVLAIWPGAENGPQERFLLAQLRFIHAIGVGLPYVELRSCNRFRSKIANRTPDVARCSRKPLGQV